MPGFYEEKIFPRVCDLLIRQFEEFRPGVVSPAKGRVLEIGFGTGRNLPHYGKIDELVGLDPSTGMNEIAEKRSTEAGFPVKVVHGAAEKLPFPDASFDTVVSTLTFCTIGDPAAAAREARRVLKKDGRFLFVEHVLAPGRRTAQWQHRLNPMWRKVFCGCELDRDTWGIFERSGFDLSGARRVTVDAPPIVRHLIVGEGRPV